MLDKDQISAISNSWRETKFKIKETEFTISKLYPMDAFHCMEVIRVGIAPILSKMKTDESGDIPLSTLLSACLSMPRATVDEASKMLFERITFINQYAKTPVKVGGNEEMAFADLDPIAIYNVLMRAVVVNFGESLSEVMRRAEAATATSSP